MHVPPKAPVQWRAMALHLVTGATDGIGRQTALELAKLGHEVIVHGRTKKKAEGAVISLKTQLPEAKLEAVWADLGSLKEVNALAEVIAEKHSTLDVLINNAGVFLKEPHRSVDGFELTMAVNHFAPFVLTHRLLPLLFASRHGRVVNVSSIAHARGRLSLDDLDLSKSGYEGYRAYAESKLANVYFTHELARRAIGVGVNCLHPGTVRTKLLVIGFGDFGADLESGAVTSVYVATAPELEGVTGRYFAAGRESNLSEHANDPVLEKAFYEKSCELTGIAPL